MQLNEASSSGEAIESPLLSMCLFCCWCGLKHPLFSTKQKRFNKCHRTHLSLSVFPDPCFPSPFKHELLSSKINTCVSKSHPILESTRFLTVHGHCPWLLGNDRMGLKPRGGCQNKSKQRSLLFLQVPGFDAWRRR